MGKFHQCLTELSACDMIMVGYYSLTFLLTFWLIFSFALIGFPVVLIKCVIYCRRL